MMKVLKSILNNQLAPRLVLPVLSAVLLVYNPASMRNWPVAGGRDAAAGPAAAVARNAADTQKKTPSGLLQDGAAPFHRGRNAMHSWRGRYGGFDSRYFTDVLAAHVIELHGDESEMENVRLAAAAIDGVVLAPNELFSFNEAVGRRTPEKGYQPGLMFSQGQVTVGVGGGICIVSTGLYNAALQAGMRIVERKPHSGVVSYAEPGFDAAIAYGSKDLKIKNDLGSPVLIQAVVDGGLLKINLYGRKRPGLEIVLLSEGYREIPFEVVEKPDETAAGGVVKVASEGRAGFEVTTVRLFKQDGRIVRREIIDHTFVPPRDRVVIVPTGSPLGRWGNSILELPTERYSMGPPPEPPGSEALEFRPPDASTISMQPKSSP